jgi:hypothetical protein
MLTHPSEMCRWTKQVVRDPIGCGPFQELSIAHNDPGAMIGVLGGIRSSTAEDAD